MKHIHYTHTGKHQHTILNPVRLVSTLSKHYSVD